MVFRDAFTKLDVLEAEELLQTINPLVDGSPYIAAQATILGMELSFYPGCRFLEIADHSSVPGRKTALIMQGNVATILDWTNQPIYRLNDAVPIMLHENNVTEYVRFFFSFVRGRHGRFLITESVDDIAWKDEPPPNARKAIGSLIAPATLSGVDEAGNFSVAALMMFKDSLFKTVIRVTPNGVVTMEDEELVVEDIPVLDDVLG